MRIVRRLRQSEIMVRTPDDQEPTRPPPSRNLTRGMLESLGRSIVVGDYEEKPFPTEADLSNEFGVSRSVTREAVKMLTAKGLLSARPRSGTVVEPPSKWNLFDPDVLSWLLSRRFKPELLRHFSELRVAIEPEAAALAAQSDNRELKVGIAAGLERMRKAELGEDDTLDADIAFHVAVLSASGNPFYAQFRDMVETALRTSIRFTNQIKGRTASVADHEAVCNAILRGDADGARKHMRRLIDDVLVLLDREEPAVA